jgi:thioredoxin reductase (NADPH)
VTDSVFLVVDNDADDLATFAGALTSRYASEYEIRTAATASEAHATLAALSVAGITVALLIVSRDLEDADLPLLLQRARELFPSVRRVLSARYLDPSAFDFITGAMRTGRIEYFLYKPCEPVVTRLYPVVDDLLGGLRRTSQERGFEAIRIIGEQWNPRSHQLRDLLERTTVPFGFYDSESEAGRRILAQAGVDGSRLPVLCIHSGAVLVDPTNEQVAVALGARTTPEPGLYDVAIVGAGPAGLAASVYAASEGLRTVLFDPETIGGQAGTSSPIVRLRLPQVPVVRYETVCRRRTDISCEPTVRSACALFPEGGWSQQRSYASARGRRTFPDASPLPQHCILP